MNTKQFPRGVVMSAVTGKMVHASFGEVHECIEHLAGHPVWTHQIPAWLRENDDRARAAFPDLAAYDLSGLSRETAEAWLAERAEYLAEVIDVATLGWKGEANPFAHLPNASIVAVVP